MRLASGWARGTGHVGVNEIEVLFFAEVWATFSAECIFPVLFAQNTQTAEAAFDEVVH